MGLGKSIDFGLNYMNENSKINVNMKHDGAMSTLLSNIACA